MRGKKLLCTIMGLAMAGAVIAGGMMAKPIDASAESKTVTGTVMKGTSGNVLVLKTSAGTMYAKYDSKSDTKDCQILLPGVQVTVDLSYGDTDYYYVKKFSSKASVAQATGNATPVVAVINDVEYKNNMISLSTITGDFSAKIDSATDMSKVGMLVAGKTVTATVIREGNSYRLVSLADYPATSTTTSTTTTTTSSSTTTTTAATETATAAPVATTAPEGVSTISVTGTIGASKPGYITVTSTDGTYNCKFDTNTDFKNGFMLIQGQKITVNIYRGSDAVMHVASTSRATAVADKATGNGAAVQFTGTVADKSNDSTLYLKTSGGTMTIKMDADTQLAGNNPLCLGSTVTATCVNCSDEYWHATSLEAK